jgi:hypothetical protein
MDTRQKIVTFARLEELLQQGSWTVVAAAFDPLTNEQAKHLASAASDDRKLAVLIEISADSLLPADARAILVAALRCVDVVAVVESVPSSIQGLEVVKDTAGERKRTEDFIHRVQAKQSGAAS